MRFQCISSVLILLVMVAGCGTNSSLFSVGTVLFRPSDTTRHCWTQENIALLTSRMLMANLMPHADNLKADDDSFTTDIIEYFRLLLETIRQNTEGKTKHIMLMAATDTIGGYMTHLILPISKYSFYAGNIQYGSIMRLYQLYDELKHFLRTNGNGWTKPWKNAGKHIQAKAISMQNPSPTSDACKGLIYHKQWAKPKKTRACTIKPKPSFHIEVPLPFFDSKSHPAAIAVPFRSFGLRNLESRVSAYVLVKYYVAVSKCMASKNSDDDDVHKFNSNIFQFVMTKVMPHLGDEKFYAAFGGVLRILQTITETTKEKGLVMGNFNIMPETLDREAAENMIGDGDDDVGTNKNVYHSNRSRNNLIVLAALATIVIWFCLGAAFVCCRIKAGQMRKQQEDDVDACKISTCPKLVDNYTSATSSDNDNKRKHTKILYNIKQNHPKISPSKSSHKKSSKWSENKSNAPNTLYTRDSDSDKSQISQARSQSFVTTSTYGSPRKPKTVHHGRSSPILRGTKSHKKRSPKRVNLPSRDSDLPTRKPVSGTKKNDSYVYDIEQEFNATDEVFLSQPSPGTSRVSPRSQHPSSTSQRSPAASRSSQRSPRSSRTSKTSQKSRRTSEASQAQRPPQIQVHSVQYYPPTFACHTSMTGKLKPNESTDDSRESTKRPYVFGYDFQTSSDETTPRGTATDGENDVGGNMSK